MKPETEGVFIGPIDDRDEEESPFEIDPVLSSPDFEFSEDDPAKGEPNREVAPAWNTEGKA